MLQEKNPIAVLCFSPNNGGMELNALLLAKILRPLSPHPLHLFCRANTFIHKSFEANPAEGVKLHPIHFKGNLSWTCISQVRQTFKQHGLKNAVFLGASELKSLAIAFRGLQVNLLNFHGTTKTHSKHDFLHRLIYRSVTTHIPVSHHIKRNIFEIIPGASEENTKVLHLPFARPNIPLEKPIRDRARIIHVGRVAPGKGHKDALSVLGRLSQKNIPFQCDFLGSIQDKQLFSELEEQTESQNLKEQVHFRGHVNNVSEHLAQSHFLIFPSAGEGLPNVLIEAFFHKVLPVTYDNTVFPEFKEMGFEFEQAIDFDVNDLESKLERTISLTREEYEAITTKNYEKASYYFSVEKIRQHYSQLFS